jgi:hypothetical protein
MSTATATFVETFKARSWRFFDTQLLLYVILLIAVGIVMGYSAGFNDPAPAAGMSQTVKTLIWAAIGLTLFVMTLGLNIISRKITRRFPPTEILSADEIESIHNASLTVLEEIGMDFTHPDARALLKAAGARIVEDRVHFDRHMIEDLMRSVPRQFTFHARNSENNVEIGGPNMVFGTVGSPPNSSDLDGGRRTGNHVDYKNFLRLAQYFNCIGFVSGYPVEPIDLHAWIHSPGLPDD